MFNVSHSLNHGGLANGFILFKTEISMSHKISQTGKGTQFNLHALVFIAKDLLNIYLLKRKDLNQNPCGAGKREGERVREREEKREIDDPNSMSFIFAADYAQSDKAVLFQTV